MFEFTGNVQLSPFAQKLRALRVKRQLSVEEAAKEIGVTPARLFRYETDREKPNNGLLRKIAAYYGVHKKELQ